MKIKWSPFAQSVIQMLPGWTYQWKKYQNLCKKVFLWINKISAVVFWQTVTYCTEENIWPIWMRSVFFLFSNSSSESLKSRTDWLWDTAMPFLQSEPVRPHIGGQEHTTPITKGRITSHSQPWMWHLKIKWEGLFSGNVCALYSENGCIFIVT